MGTWTNADGLYIRYGADEADVASGGQYSTDGSLHEVEVQLAYTDFDSATYAMPHSSADAFGVVLPKGARVEEIETVVTTAFTSSGTIGTSTLGIGLKKASDRSTELDHDGFTTASFTGTEAGLATVGTKKVIRVGSTGAGVLLGTTLAENGVLVLSNTLHASHPHTAGAIRIRIRYYFP
jgi:hypothetical protein